MRAFVTRNLESKCMSSCVRFLYNERNRYAVVVVKDGVVVILSKAVSRILAALHMGSKGINLELISSFKKYMFNKFSWFHQPAKNF